MSDFTRPAIKLSIQRLFCEGCGAEANASCNCGKPYLPKSVRAAEVIAANPEKSDRAIAAEIGASPTTVGKARDELSTSGQLVDGPRIGLDGKIRHLPERRMDVHFSSATDEWSTPQDLFDELHAEFKFELDVCALPSSAKCKKFFSPDDDGLNKEWSGNCWMNPPYGEVIGKWVEKARFSATSKTIVVCLVPARVDTAWWWDNCRYGEIRFLRGRLKFGGSENSAPFPSAVVIFGRPANVIWWER